MSEKKCVKRIGWMIKIRTSKDLPWVIYNYTCGVDKTDAIRKFININTHMQYHNLYKRGLARCVPVYVEVQDAKA